jgi:glycosyltransferase involved in cell wall biosynthesis
MNTESTPAKVGIFMPCFNLGNYIDEALDSLFSQTFQDFDLIIADDCSTDKATLNKLKSLKLPKGKIFYEKTNLGMLRISNKYMELLDNQYLMIFSPDDKMHPRLLEESVRYLDANADKSAVCTWMKLMGDEKGIHKFSQERCTLPYMLVENYYSGAAMIRKELWRSIGGFDLYPPLSAHEDYVFWISALEKGCELGVIAEPLFYYRRHAVSRSRTVQREEERAFRDSLLQKYEDLYKKYAPFVLAHYWKLLDKYEQDFLEYAEGHEWLDSQYKSQKETITVLEARVKKLEKILGIKVLRRIKPSHN